MLIPKGVQENEIKQDLEKKGIKRIKQGGNWDAYDLGDRILLIASDRINFSGFVLNDTIPHKGEIMTALTHFWCAYVLKTFPHPLLWSQDSPGKNAARDLKKELPKIPLNKSLVVKKINFLPYKFIFYHHLGEEIYEEYIRTGWAGDQNFPPDFPKWSKLGKPVAKIYLKNETGKEITASEFKDKYGWKGENWLEMCRGAYQLAYKQAERSGLLILKTELKGDLSSWTGEFLTPESSCFCTFSRWCRIMKEGKDIPDDDKLKDWAEKIATPFPGEKDENLAGLHNLDPRNKEHLNWVHGLKLPPGDINLRAEKSLKIFELLTGFHLREYQKKHLL